MEFNRIKLGGYSRMGDLQPRLEYVLMKYIMGYGIQSINQK